MYSSRKYPIVIDAICKPDGVTARPSDNNGDVIRPEYNFLWDRWNVI